MLWTDVFASVTGGAVLADLLPAVTLDVRLAPVVAVSLAHASHIVGPKPQQDHLVDWEAAKDSTILLMLQTHLRQHGGRWL